MNKDQIIIDGVNLSNIRLYLETGHRSSVSTKEFEKIIDLLERKTQEMNSIHEYYKELRSNATELANKNIQLKEQLEGKEQELYLARNEVHSKTEYIQEQRDIIKQLQQECEELKERASIAEDNFACEIQARLYHQNEWLKFSEENDRYRKALEEIEQLFEHRCDICRNNYGLGADCSVCWHKDIKNIISRAKGI